MEIMTQSISGGLESMIMLASGYQPFHTNNLFHLERILFENTKITINKERLRISFVPYAAGMGEEYGKQFYKYMKKNHEDCDVDILPSINSPDNAIVAQMMIRRADVVYMGAGNTEKLENGLDMAMIKEDLKDKRFIFAYSAGAYMIQDSYESLSVEVENVEEFLASLEAGNPIPLEVKRYDSIREGLGIVKGKMVLVHGRTYYPNKKSLSVIASMAPEGTELYWLEENCALFITNNGTSNTHFLGNDAIDRIEMTPEGLKRTRVFYGHGKEPANNIN